MFNSTTPNIIKYKLSKGKSSEKHPYNWLQTGASDESTQYESHIAMEDKGKTIRGSPDTKTTTTTTKDTNMQDEYFFLLI